MQAGTDPVVRLNPGLDPRAIAAVFARHGRAHIPGIFPTDVAERIHRALVAETPWSRVVSGTSRHYDFGPGGWEAIPADRRAETRSRALETLAPLADASGRLTVPTTVRYTLAERDGP
jgi:hypothetical protein